jgi:hypothetical protein
VQEAGLGAKGRLRDEAGIGAVGRHRGRRQAQGQAAGKGAGGRHRGRRQMEADEGSWQGKGSQCKDRLNNLCKKGADSAETTGKRRGDKAHEGESRYKRSC